MVQNRHIKTVIAGNDTGSVLCVTAQTKEQRNTTGRRTVMNPSPKKRYKLIACEVMFREICQCASVCDNIIDINFVQKGLHDIGAEKMSAQLQVEIDEVDANTYDAILLCYGLCNNGVIGLSANIPLVIPRAHDCITLLLGSKEKYKSYFDANPGTFFKSSGWIERGGDIGGGENNVMSQLGLGKSYADYVELYGEENADFIMEMLGNWTENYSKSTYIDTGLGNIAFDRAEAKKDAESHNWEYEEIKGDTRLIMNLLNGKWDESEFLVVSPKSKIQPSNDSGIVTAAT